MRTGDPSFSRVQSVIRREEEDDRERLSCLPSLRPPVAAPLSARLRFRPYCLIGARSVVAIDH